MNFTVMNTTLIVSYS